MPVILKSSVSVRGLADLAKEAMEAQRESIYRRLAYIGEQCVNEARMNGRYTDRTGNLRGSVGYCISDNGVILNQGGFLQVLKGTEGPKNGADFASEIASQTEGIALILVAGMRYAIYVEDRGFNVLISAEDLAKGLISQLFEGN